MLPHGHLALFSFEENTRLANLEAAYRQVAKALRTYIKRARCDKRVATLFELQGNII